MSTVTKPLKIGIQGVKASFHDCAAQDYFVGQEIALNECTTFRSLCEVLVEGKTDFNMMAIENSIAGSILPNYLLLEKFKLQIIGEIYLRIEMNLMALPGQKISELKYVQSHAMALFQCEDFLAAHEHMQIMESADTAESAKEIREKNKLGYCAIASRRAAEVYNLEILASSIETNKQNYTRFLVVSRNPRVVNQPKADKASLRFEMTHQPGSLLSILSSLSAHGINMTKLQSVPLLGRPSQYSFHIDIEWSDDDSYQNVMAEIRTKAINLIHFGEYKKSERPGL